MSTLFTLTNAWHDCVWLFEQLAFSSAGDAILLTQDATLAAHSPITLASFLAKCQTMSVAVYLLKEDSAMRGVVNQYPELTEVSYADFVNLVVEHDKQVAW